MSLPKVSLIAIAVAASGAAMPSMAVAQSEANAAVDDGVIIVTARNREESIQDVPLAITAFGEDEIDKRGLQGLDDVARFTPGFSFESFSGGFALPVIRGQAQSRVTALETNVSTFYDGIYIPRAWAVDVGTSNLERVEIVKGPQSARYGRNAFAGAINYVPKKAKLTGEISGEIEATVGTDERLDGSAFINVSNDQMAVAGSFNYSEFDGTWDNAHPFANLDIGRGTQGNIGGYENYTATLSTIIEPTDGLTFEVSYAHSNQKNEARASRYIGDVNSRADPIGIGGILDPNDITATDNGLREITNCGAPRSNNNNPGFPDTVFPLICGEFPAPADSALVDPRSYGTYSKTGIFRAKAGYDFGDGFNISYLFGNITGNVDIGTSGEPDPINCGTLIPGLCNFQVTPVGDINYDSHELRLAYSGSNNLSGAIGAFYSEGRDRNTFRSISLAPITDANDFVPLVGAANEPNDFVNRFVFLLGNERTDTEVKAVFGELMWTSGDGMTRIGGEIRYAETEITSIDVRRDITLSETFKEITPRATLERDLNDDVMVYATVARGAKSGGFNPTALPTVENGVVVDDNLVFDPEYNWTYELGFKGDAFDGRMNFNVAAFYTDWTDIQINAPNDLDNPNSASITKNLGNAEVYGIEVAANVFLTDNLTLDATFSHTEGSYADGTEDFRFGRGSDFAFGPPCGDVVCDSGGDVSGNDIERTTPTQASAGLQYNGTFGDNDYFARVDGSWQSSFFGDSANLSVIPERFLMNAAAGVTFSESLSLRIWARNLLDKKYISNAFAVLLPFGNTYGTFYGQRRTMGLTAKIDF